MTIRVVPYKTLAECTYVVICPPRAGRSVKVHNQKIQTTFGLELAQLFWSIRSGPLNGIVFPSIPDYQRHLTLHVAMERQKHTIRPNLHAGEFGIGIERRASRASIVRKALKSASSRQSPPQQQRGPKDDVAVITRLLKPLVLCVQPEPNGSQAGRRRRPVCTRCVLTHQ